jgi:DNA primase
LIGIPALFAEPCPAHSQAALNDSRVLHPGIAASRRYRRPDRCPCSAQEGGRQLRRLLPFHNEKSPSFTVSPTKQFYHCFGCGAHGTAIGFLMEYSGLGFIDAVKDLAGRTGMQVPEQEGRRRHDDRPRDFQNLPKPWRDAAKYYYEQLKHSPKAIDYLKRRGLSGEIAQKFGIGYAPDGWQNLETVFRGLH